jgi:hypothetical protein
MQRNRTHARGFCAWLESLEQRQLFNASIVGSSTVYTTIQAAVNAALAGQTINVDAGTYPELVTVSKTLTIRGAQAGVDARLNTRQTGTGESTVTGTTTSTGSRTSGFYITADNVTIDGFTVQGNTSESKYGAGIVIAPNHSGTHILDNILQNNVSGLRLANNSSTNAAIIQHNVFRNNNNDGETGGRGIYTDASVSGGNLTNVLIDGNFFSHNSGGSGSSLYEAAIHLGSYTANSQSNITVSNNIFESNGKSVLAWNVTNLSITGNFSTYNHDESSGGLRFEGGLNNVTVTGNTLMDGPGTAIRIDNKAFPADNKNFVITGNNFIHNGQDGFVGGLRVIAQEYSGLLDARNNYWGSASGPSGDGPGTGDAIQINGNNVLYSAWATAPIAVQQYPFYGTPATAGAPIQAEEFDEGGAGLAYADSDVPNNVDYYREYESVDIEPNSDGGVAGYDVTSTVKGEWTAYTVNIPQDGDYNFDFRVATAQSTGGLFHLEVDGVNVTGSLRVPSTGSNNTWQTLTRAGVTLAAGTHQMRLVMDSGGSNGNIGNFNWFKYTLAGAATLPNAPSNLKATAASSSQIDLTWTDNSTNETGFGIERSTDGVNFTVLAFNIPSQTYSDTGLAPGVTYYYRVHATNAAGDSATSNIDSATTLPATSATTYLSDLTWTSATVGYGTVQKNKSIGGNALKLRGTTYASGIGTHANSTITYNLAGQYNTFISDVGVDDEILSKGTGTVIFRVVGDGVTLFNSGTLTNSSDVVHIAVDITGVKQLDLVVTDAGDGIDYDHADWAGAAVLGIPQAPSIPPSNLKTTVVSATQINLAWQNNAANQTGVKIERSTDGTTFSLVTTVDATATSYSDINLAGSTTYTYRVRATNSIGDSAPSATASGTTFNANATTTYLSDLTWTSATAGFGTVQKDKSINGNAIKLRGKTYAKGIGTHAVSTITYNLSGLYTNFTSDIGVDDEAGGNGSVIFQVFADGVKIYDSGALTGSSAAQTLNLNTSGVQQLKLVATNGVSGIDYDHADWANAAVLGVPAAPTAAPTNLKTTVVSASQINLAWQNNAANQTGVKIERSTDGTNFSLIATLGATATTYNDTGLAGSTTYTYRLRATNAVGDSDPSATSSAATFSATAVTTYLSDLPWATATSGFGSVQLDKTITGNSIKLRGTTYAKGIGTHAVSTITYNLGGLYTNFTSDIGVDDEVSGNGSVIFQVFADGTKVYDSGALTGSSAMQSINLDLTGVQQLKLVATTGVSGIDYDHADWAGAALVGQPIKPSMPIALNAGAISSSQITLTWRNTPSGQTNNKIMRSTDGVNYTQVGTTPANATTFTDSLLSPSTSYTYRIVASNSAGDSDPSNSSSATTFSATAVPVYLSDLTWTSATTGFGTIGKDKTINSNTITLRGVTYTKGIGAHAASTITYNLAGGYTNFLSDVGVDDEVNGNGSVIFKVYADGVQVYDSGAVTGASATASINLDVRGVQQLQLVATNGIPNNIDYDHADWAGARLIPVG